MLVSSFLLELYMDEVRSRFDSLDVDIALMRRDVQHLILMLARLERQEELRADRLIQQVASGKKHEMDVLMEIMQFIQWLLPLVLKMPTKPTFMPEHHS